MVGRFQKPERRERARDGADGVHEALEAEGAAEPSRGAGEEHMISVRSESERRCRKRGEGVAKDGERFSALQAIGEMAGGQLREARETVGNTFDRAKPHRTRADGGEEGGEDRSSRFVAPIAEQAGQADTEDGAVEPGSIIS